MKRTANDETSLHSIAGSTDGRPAAVGCESFALCSSLLVDYDVLARGLL